MLSALFVFFIITSIDEVHFRFTECSLFIVTKNELRAFHSINRVNMIDTNR